MNRRADDDSPQGPVAPTVPEVLRSPELSAVFLLENALRVARAALLAEHPTLIDDYARARDVDPVLALAHRICRGSAALEDSLRRFRLAVRAAYDIALAPDVDEDDLPF